MILSNTDITSTQGENTNDRPQQYFLLVVASVLIQFRFFPTTIITACTLNTEITATVLFSLKSYYSLSLSP